MVLKTDQQLGQVLASITNSQSRLNQNISYEEVDPLIQITPIESISLAQTTFIYRKYYPTDSFILDHPVYGEVDSSVLKLDGGYLAGSEQVLFETIIT